MFILQQALREVRTLAEDGVANYQKMGLSPREQAKTRQLNRIYTAAQRALEMHDGAL